MRGEPPPPAAQVDAFARLVGSSKRGRAPAPAPSGQIPKGIKWGEWNGVWVNIDSTAATTTDANEDEDDSDPDQPVVDASSAKRRDRYRPYKSLWKDDMPFLVLISALSGSTACPSKLKGGRFVCWLSRVRATLLHRVPAQGQGQHIHARMQKLPHGWLSHSHAHSSPAAPTRKVSHCRGPGEGSPGTRRENPRHHVQRVPLC